MRGREVVLGAFDGGPLLRQRRRDRGHVFELAAHLGGVGHQRLEHAFVGDGGELPLQPAPFFSSSSAENPDVGGLQRLDVGERKGQVAVTGGGEQGLGLEDGGVEVAAGLPAPPPRCG